MNIQLNKSVSIILAVVISCITYLPTHAKSRYTPNRSTIDYSAALSPKKQVKLEKHHKRALQYIPPSKTKSEDSNTVDLNAENFKLLAVMTPSMPKAGKYISASTPYLNEYVKGAYVMFRNIRMYELDEVLDEDAYTYDTAGNLPKEPIAHVSVVPRSGWVGSSYYRIAVDFMPSGISKYDNDKAIELLTWNSGESLGVMNLSKENNDQMLTYISDPFVVEHDIDEGLQVSWTPMPVNLHTSGDGHYYSGNTGKIYAIRLYQVLY
ncbi:hypothetical protein H0A36_27275 [Endozoicomonas sp. SM1973]|uniref:Uncharacterized protein n=1 Tax=Spartinivicinus marinus TaxID=2994442 RepID=A0A853II37_9GAMM|nr:hypothetical protein [Spartinivicinus marinus]MCX4025958.1 hypothetical protein [Spartinivicinus marinus]NYZ69721.1 hypothetical protein [Spartinivicinus marinus]